MTNNEKKNFLRSIFNFLIKSTNQKPVCAHFLQRGFLFQFSLGKRKTNITKFSNIKLCDSL